MSQNHSGSLIVEAVSTVPDSQALVSFIGIGAQKCASTWLHDVLVDHPALSLPGDVKEVDYFSYHYDFGRQWYEQRFTSAASSVCGEVSPSYLHSPGVVERVADYNPGMRIILIVRDPIERAISNHKHEVRIGHVHGDDLSFEFGLRNNPAYIEQGLYAKHLESWYEKFSPEQILVLKFEDVVALPEAALVSVCEFLGANSDYRSPKLYLQSNRSYLSRSSGFEKTKNKLRAGVRALGLGGLWQRLGDTGLRQRYRNLNHVDADVKLAAPLPETLQRMRDIFQPDVEKLSRMTGLSTTDWLQQ